MATTFYQTLAARTIFFVCITLLLLLQPLAVMSTRVLQSEETQIQAGSQLERRSILSWWAELNGCKVCDGGCQLTQYVVVTGNCCSLC
ncbi:hypothetical protein Mapa_017386 [Marchantia paleacea]|nr:hypothetical protein Mapa_017386 [Marchantia paleacea]